MSQSGINFKELLKENIELKEKLETGNGCMGSEEMGSTVYFIRVYEKKQDIHKT